MKYKMKLGDATFKKGATERDIVFVPISPSALNWLERILKVRALDEIFHYSNIKTCQKYIDIFDDAWSDWYSARKEKDKRKKK